MNSVILPYEMQVEAIVYQHQAFALGIIKPNISQYDQWLCNKFINCSCIQLYDLYDDDLWMERDRFSIKTSEHMARRVFMGLCPDIITRNKQMLEQGFYIWGTYDEFYIPGKAAYQQNCFIHGYLIYGYDDREGVFKSAGYLANGRYVRFDIKYENYYRSVVYIDDVRQLQLGYYHINKNYEGLIDVPIIKERLTDYLDSRGCEKPKTDEVFGVNVWKNFETYIGGTKGNQVDMRNVRAYMEHKILMDKRIRCLLARGYLRNQALSQNYREEVSRRAMQLFYMSLKYVLTGDKDLRKRMTDLVGRINVSDQKLLEEVVDLL